MRPAKKEARMKIQAVAKFQYPIKSRNLVDQIPSLDKQLTHIKLLIYEMN
jgi:hypothetical protein